MAQDPVEYRMRVHLFGAVSSPSCCSFAIQKTAEDNKGSCHAETIQTVRHNFYVDDCLKSVESDLIAITLVHQLRQLLVKGGFHLTKWLSNARHVIEAIPESERATTVKNLDFEDLPIERALSEYTGTFNWTSLGLALQSNLRRLEWHSVNSNLDLRSTGHSSTIYLARALPQRNWLGRTYT